MGSWSQLRALRSTRLGGHYPRLTVAENNLLRSEAADRARLLADLHYDVTLDLTGEGLFRSETRLRCRANHPGASTFLDLTAVRLESASVNGVPVGADAFDVAAGRL